jgi:beta-glucosidase
VKFTLAPEDLAFYRADMTWGYEPGMFDLFIGGDSQDVKAASFELKDEHL